MADLFNTPTTADTKDEWLTPPWIINSLGDFDLDPCAPIVRPWPMAKEHYTIEDNGLMKPWRGRVWLNPPYGRETFKWMARMAEHRTGIALIFARTDTMGFHREIFGKARGMLFLKGRIQFCHVDGTAGDRPNAASCLVAYSDADCRALEACAIPGRYVFLGNGYADCPTCGQGAKCECSA